MCVDRTGQDRTGLKLPAVAVVKLSVPSMDGHLEVGGQVLT